MHGSRWRPTVKEILAAEGYIGIFIWS